MALRKIKLYGKLGQIFGKEWILDVNSVAEAVRAIDSNTKGKFSLYLLKGQGSKRFYKISVKNKKNIISENEILGSFGSGDIYITPYIRGSGKYGQLIAGVVLIAVSYYMGGFGAGAASGAGGSTAMWGAYIGQIGIALTLGGIAQLLAVSKASSSDQRNSSLFQGNATTVYQGTSVGIVYGRALVSPMPVCVSQDSLSQNSYEGEILQVGKLGSPLDTEILYSYRGGTASLCGIDEYVPSDGSGVSTPPKRFLCETWSGEGGCSDTSYHYCVMGGSIVIDPATCTQTDGTTVNGSPSYWSWVDGDEWCLAHLSNLCDLVITETRTRTVCTRTYVRTYECEYCGTIDATWVRTLSAEDTELDAIARLLPTLTWSAWQSTPIYPYYYRDPSNFNIYYREVRIKTVTIEKYNPGINYRVSATYQRRAYGSSDTWVDAETVVTNQKPNSSGDFEINIPNVSGYETKIKTLTINI